jgi:biotin carboxylase
MSRQRILILGGSKFQVPLIRRAKELGLHVATCDYLPGNPAHRLADEYHDVSTTDLDGVLALARRIGIDAIASMSSDPAMPAVAYVADALGLPGASPRAIATMTRKDAFRQLLSNHGLPVPEFKVFGAEEVSRAEGLAAALALDAARCVVKPVDSCGSKGVAVLEPHDDPAPALRIALAQSRAGRCIVERYIDGAHLHGDGYLRRGRLIHQYLGDQGSFAGPPNLIPVSTLWPSGQAAAVISEVARQVEAIAQASGYLDGPLNIEARVTPAGEVFVIEIGPRNGGDYIPIIQCRLTGFDFVQRVLDDALGLDSAAQHWPMRMGIGACYTLHADRDGIFAGLRVSETIRGHVFLLEAFRQEGEPVLRHTSSNTSLGVVGLEFDNLAERDRLMGDLRSHLVPVVV